MKRTILILIAFVNGMLAPAHAALLSTAFTYQGRLTDNGLPANGTYDFQFRLFDAATNGAQLPVVLGHPTLAVSNRLFTAVASMRACIGHEKLLYPMGLQHQPRTIE